MCNSVTILCQENYISKRRPKNTTRNLNKTCHRDRIARLTAPCPSHKNFNGKLFANADASANADTGGSIIALPGLRPSELNMCRSRIFVLY